MAINPDKYYGNGNVGIVPTNFGTTSSISTELAKMIKDKMNKMTEEERKLLDSSGVQISSFLCPNAFQLRVSTSQVSDLSFTCFSQDEPDANLHGTLSTTKKDYSIKRYGIVKVKSDHWVASKDIKGTLEDVILKLCQKEKITHAEYFDDVDAVGKILDPSIKEITTFSQPYSYQLRKSTNYENAFSLSFCQEQSNQITKIGIKVNNEGFWTTTFNDETGSKTIKAVKLKEVIDQVVKQYGLKQCEFYSQKNEAALSEIQQTAIVSEEEITDATFEDRIKEMNLFSKGLDPQILYIVKGEAKQFLKSYAKELYESCFVVIRDEKVHFNDKENRIASFEVIRCERNQVNFVTHEFVAKCKWDEEDSKLLYCYENDKNWKDDFESFVGNDYKDRTAVFKQRLINDKNSNFQYAMQTCDFTPVTRVDKLTNTLQLRLSSSKRNCLAIAHWDNVGTKKDYLIPISESGIDWKIPNSGIEEISAGSLKGVIDQFVEKNGIKHFIKSGEFIEIAKK